MPENMRGPDEDNVSDDMAEALMQNVIRNLRAALKNPEDYRARSNLMWAGTMAGNVASALYYRERAGRGQDFSVSGGRGDVFEQFPERQRPVRGRVPEDEDSAQRGFGQYLSVQ